MPRLNVVEVDQASGKVAETYEGIKAKFGKVLNIFKGMGNSSAALNAYLCMAGALAEGELSPQDREVIYLGVSEQNGCHYCVSAHTLAARKAGMSDDQILAARRLDPMGDQHQALLKFVRRVIETRGFVDDQEIEAVRAAGYSDGQLAEAVGYIALATYSNLFNHVFDTPLDLPGAPQL